MQQDYQVFALGRVMLEQGGVLLDAWLAYQTYGTLNAACDNVVVMPTYYTGTHRECAKMIGTGRALDPDRYFIVVPNLMGNGLSSSPSNSPAPHGGADFPVVTILDNVRFQRRMLNELWDLERVSLVVGWSMGAQQAYQWAVSYPNDVRAILPICGSARTSIHNRVFLEGVKAALLADPGFDNGRYRSPPIRGLEAFGRVYAGWAYSQTFFREQRFKELGCESADELLDRWAIDHASWDANDLLAMLSTWQHADVSTGDEYGGDFERALGGVRARAIVMPCATDLYFPPEDSRHEVEHMANAELQIIPSAWGHIAGSPLYDQASKPLIDAAIRELLAG